MDNPMMRELFVDELTQFTGGQNPLDTIKQLIEDIKNPNTTHACCEEGQCCSYLELWQ